MSAATSVHSHGDLTPSEISTYYTARLPQLNQKDGTLGAAIAPKIRFMG